MLRISKDTVKLLNDRMISEGVFKFPNKSTEKLVTVKWGAGPTKGPLRRHAAAGERRSSHKKSAKRGRRPPSRQLLPPITS